MPELKQNNKNISIKPTPEVITYSEEQTGPPESTLLDTSKHISLDFTKKLYNHKEALESLDEEFREFFPKSYSIKSFFNLYNGLFYSLSRDTHQHLIDKSSNYAFPEGYNSRLMREILDLLDQLKETQKNIDSVEREHNYFKNGIFLMDKNYKNKVDSGILNSGGNIYYIQSSRKRNVTNEQTFQNIKSKTLKNQEDITNKNFIVFVNASTLDKIPNGPDINSLEDIYISSFEINIYPQTVGEYDPMFEEPQNTVSSNIRGSSQKPI